MLTQMMPAFIDALRQALPPNALGPLAQALGNCGQPLTHRAGVNFPGALRPNRNGTFSSSSWNPSEYTNLFPGGNASFAGGDEYNSAEYHNTVDLGGMTSVWNEGNRYDSQFYFPTSQVFNQNQYYGGPTIHITGGQDVDYISNQYFDGDTVNITNLTTETVNGDPVDGPQGPPGAAGRDGERGAPGAPGAFFAALPPGRFGKIRYLTGRPWIHVVEERVARKHRYMKNAWIRGAIEVGVPTNAISGASVTVTPGEAKIDVPTNAISGGSVTITSKSASFNLPTNAIAGGTMTLSPAPVAVTVPLTISFDPDTCTVNIDSTTTVYAFPSLPGTQTLDGTPATTDVKVVASTDTVTATISGDAATKATFTVAAAGSFSATVETTAASTVSIIAATTAASTLASHIPSSGFVVKGLDADFWEREPASVLVASNPQLMDIHPMQMRVFRQ